MNTIVLITDNDNDDNSDCDSDNDDGVSRRSHANWMQ